MTELRVGRVKWAGYDDEQIVVEMPDGTIHALDEAESDALFADLGRVKQGPQE